MLMYSYLATGGAWRMGSKERVSAPSVAVQSSCEILSGIEL